MKNAVIIISLFAFIVSGKAQNINNGSNVGIGTTSPAASAQLDVNSTTKGLLPPRMTTLQRDLIASPAAGLVIFNNTIKSLQLFTGSEWASLGTSSAVFMPTIVIGTQQWMAMNLEVAFYRNGDPIPQVTDFTTWSNLTTGAWCYHNNDSTRGNTNGKLYNWFAVNDPRGLAPAGWHIPSEAEWTKLENSLGGALVAGGKMKAAGVSYWLSPNSGGNNNSSWSGLPGGRRDNFGTFYNFGRSTYYWSSTQNSTTDSWFWALSYNAVSITRYFFDTKNGLAIRCIRD